MLFNVIIEDSLRRFLRSLDEERARKVGEVVADAIEEMKKNSAVERLQVMDAIIVIEREDETVTVNAYPENTFIDITVAMSQAVKELGNALATYDGAHNDIYHFINQTMNRDRLSGIVCELRSMLDNTATSANEERADAIVAKRMEDMEVTRG